MYLYWLPQSPLYFEISLNNSTSVVELLFFSKQYHKVKNKWKVPVSFEKWHEFIPRFIQIVSSVDVLFAWYLVKNVIPQTLAYSVFFVMTHNLHSLSRDMAKRVVQFKVMPKKKSCERLYVLSYCTDRIMFVHVQREFYHNVDSTENLYWIQE